MARKPKPAFNGADPVAFDHDVDGKPGGSLPANTVTVIEADKIHDGQGGTFPVGAVIPVTPEQAASLRLQGYAE